MPEYRSGTGYKILLTKEEGEAVKKAIRQKGLTIGKAARALLINDRSVLYWFSGKVPIRYDDAVRLYHLAGENPEIKFLIDHPSVQHEHYAQVPFPTRTFPSYNEKELTQTFGEFQEIFAKVDEEQQAQLLRDLLQVLKRYEHIS